MGAACLTHQGRRLETVANEDVATWVLTTISCGQDCDSNMEKGADMASPVKAWRERISRVVRRAIKSNGLPSILRVVAAHNEPGWPNLSGYEAQADEYMRSAWVYVAVTRIAEAAALVPYEVYAVEEEGRIAQIDHPIERLLRNPNPMVSQFEMIEATFGFLELTGNAFWYLAGGSDGLPAEIWP